MLGREMGLDPRTSGPPYFEMSDSYALSLLVELSRERGPEGVCLFYQKGVEGQRGKTWRVWGGTGGPLRRDLKEAMEIHSGRQTVELTGTRCPRFRSSAA